eukprot:TRINITY_DN10104_c3_g1_i2.p1 TRINITY_DN10104_c3_g1~~TRINITY_DN10104_c3_g1_i2.p1  ORF type:complete len:1727 (+),score=412.53 TRINITY_DN10104_c3_g1_i2:2210-7390(+)
MQWLTSLSIRAASWGKGRAAFNYQYRSTSIQGSSTPFVLQFLDAGVGLPTNTNGATLAVSVAGTPSVLSRVDCALPNPTRNLVNESLWLVPGSSAATTTPRTCVVYPLDAYGARVPAWPDDFLLIATEEDAVVLGDPQRADPALVIDAGQIPTNGTGGAAALNETTDASFAVVVPVSTPARWPVDKDTVDLQVSAMLNHGVRLRDVLTRIKFGSLPVQFDTGLRVQSSSRVSVGLFPEPAMSIVCNGHNASAGPVLIPAGARLICQAVVRGVGTNLPSFWSTGMNWTWSAGGSEDNVLVASAEEWGALLVGGEYNLSAVLVWGPGRNSSAPLTVVANATLQRNAVDVVGSIQLSTTAVDLKAEEGRSVVVAECVGFADVHSPLTFAIARVRGDVFLGVAGSERSPVPGEYDVMTTPSHNATHLFYPLNPTESVVTVRVLCVAIDVFGAEAPSRHVNVTLTSWIAPTDVTEDGEREAQEVYALRILNEVSLNGGVYSVDKIAQTAGNIYELRRVSPVTLNRLAQALTSRLHTGLDGDAHGPDSLSTLLRAARMLAATTARTISDVERDEAHMQVAALLGALPVAPMRRSAVTDLVLSVGSVLGTLGPFGEAVQVGRRGSPLLVSNTEGVAAAGQLQRAMCVAGAGLVHRAAPGECEHTSDSEGIQNLTACVMRVSELLSAPTVRISSDALVTLHDLVSGGRHVSQSATVTVVGSAFDSSPYGFDPTSKSVIGPVVSLCVVDSTGAILNVGAGSGLHITAPITPTSGRHVNDVSPQLQVYDGQNGWAARRGTDPQCRHVHEDLVFGKTETYETRGSDNRVWYPINVTAKDTNGTYSGLVRNSSSRFGHLWHRIRREDIREEDPSRIAWWCSGLSENAGPVAIAVVSSQASQRCSARDIEGCAQVNSGTADSAGLCACLRCGHGFLPEPVDGRCRRSVTARCGETKRVFSDTQCAGHSVFDPLWGRCVCGPGQVCFGDPGVCTITKHCGEVAAEVECLAAAAFGGPALNHNDNLERCTCHEVEAGGSQWCDRATYLHVCRPSLGCELEAVPTGDAGLAAADARQREWEQGKELIYSNHTFSSFVTDPLACGFNSVLDTVSGRCICNSTFICEASSAAHSQCIPRARCSEHPLRNESRMCRLDLGYSGHLQGTEVAGATLVRLVVSETSANPVTPVTQTAARFASDLLAMVFSWGGLNATALNATGVNTTRKSILDGQARFAPQGPWMLVNASARAEQAPSGDSHTIAASLAVQLSTPYADTEPKHVHFINDLVAALGISLHHGDAPDGIPCTGLVDSTIFCRFEVSQVNLYSEDEKLDGSCYCLNDIECAAGECTCPPCQNGGTCEYDAVNSPDDHNCTCPEGWEGVDCSTREQQQYRFIHYRYPSANYTSYNGLSSGDQSKFLDGAMTGFSSLSAGSGVSNGSDYTLVTATPSQGSVVVSFTLELFGSTFTRRVNTTMGTATSARALGQALNNLGISSIGDFRSGAVDTTRPTAYNCTVIAGCLRPLSDCTCDACRPGMMPNVEKNKTECVSSALCNLQDCSGHGIPSGFQALTPPARNASGLGCSCVCGLNYTTTPGKLDKPFCDVDFCLDPRNWSQPGCGALRCSRRFDGRTAAGSRPGECYDSSSDHLSIEAITLVIVLLGFGAAFAGLFVFYFTKHHLPWEDGVASSKKVRVKHETLRGREIELDCSRSAGVSRSASASPSQSPQSLVASPDRMLRTAPEAMQV